MENIIIRNVAEKDIPSIADIQVNGWKTAYKGIIDDSISFFKLTFSNCANYR